MYSPSTKWFHFEVNCWYFSLPFLSGFSYSVNSPLSFWCVQFIKPFLIISHLLYLPIILLIFPQPLCLFLLFLYYLSYHKFQLLHWSIIFSLHFHLPLNFIFKPNPLFSFKFHKLKFSLTSSPSCSSPLPTSCLPLRIYAVSPLTLPGCLCYPGPLSYNFS